MPLNVDTISTGSLIVNGAEITKEIIILPAPIVPGETITVNLSKWESIVKFDGPITNAFNLNTVAVNAKLGDKLYLIMNSDGSSYTVTSTGSLLFNDCGPSSPPSTYVVNTTENVIIPFLFDGTNFVGLDYC